MSDKAITTAPRRSCKRRTQPAVACTARLQTLAAVMLLLANATHGLVSTTDNRLPVPTLVCDPTKATRSSITVTLTTGYLSNTTVDTQAYGWYLVGIFPGVPTTCTGLGTKLTPFLPLRQSLSSTITIGEPFENDGLTWDAGGCIGRPNGFLSCGTNYTATAQYVERSYNGMFVVNESAASDEVVDVFKVLGYGSLGRDTYTRPTPIISCATAPCTAPATPTSPLPSPLPPSGGAAGTYVDNPHIELTPGDTFIKVSIFRFAMEGFDIMTFSIFMWPTGVPDVWPGGTAPGRQTCWLYHQNTSVRLGLDPIETPFTIGQPSSFSNGQPSSSGDGWQWKNGAVSPPDLSTAPLACGTNYTFLVVTSHANSTVPAPDSTRQTVQVVTFVTTPCSPSPASPPPASPSSLPPPLSAPTQTPGVTADESQSKSSSTGIIVGVVVGVVGAVAVVMLLWWYLRTQGHCLCLPVIGGPKPSGADEENVKDLPPDKLATAVSNPSSIEPTSEVTVTLTGSKRRTTSSPLPSLHFSSPTPTLMRSTTDRSMLGPVLTKIPWATVTIGKELGRGGFGTVCKGQWRRNPVAVKMLQTEKMSPEAKEALRQEALVMCELRHPCIAPVYGIVDDGEHHALVMKYYKNGTVAMAIADGSYSDLSVLNRIRMALQVATGMCCLHERDPAPILHGDLKTSNLLLDDEGRVVIADFGLACSLQPGQIGKAVQSGAMTVSISPPEVLEDRMAPRTAAGDVYAFGIVLLEMASACATFRGMNAANIIDAVTSGRRPTLPPCVPADLAAIIQACWAQDPNARPSFSEVTAMLEAAVEAHADGTADGTTTTI